MNASRTIFVPMLGIACALIVAGCTEQTSPQNSLNNESSACPPYQRPENSFFTVVKEEPFTYKGVVPNPDIQFVQVEVQSPFLDCPSVSESVPVNLDGTFTFSLNGSWTQAWGDMRLTGENSAPYRVTLNFTTTEDHFNLNIVQTPADIQCIQNSTWIHINPLKSVQVSSGLRNVTHDLIINGTTNLPPGDEITFMIMSTYIIPCQNIPIPDNVITHCTGPLEHKVKVQKSFCSANTWSYDINTSYYRFTDYEYVVYVSAVNKSQNNCGSWDATRLMLELDKPLAQGLTPVRIDKSMIATHITPSLDPHTTSVRQDSQNY